MIHSNYFAPFLQVSQIGANVISINLFGCTRNTAERKWILFPKKLKERHPKKLKNMQQFFGTGKKNSRYVVYYVHRSPEISKKSRKKTYLKKQATREKYKSRKTPRK